MTQIKKLKNEFPKKLKIKIQLPSNEKGDRRPPRAEKIPGRLIVPILKGNITNRVKYPSGPKFPGKKLKLETIWVYVKICLTENNKGSVQEKPLRH